MQNNKMAIPAIILATALGASSGLYIKSLPFSSLALTGFRMGIPFLFFLPLMIKRGLLLGSPKNRKKLLVGSVLNSLRMIFYVMSYKLTTLTNAVVLLYLWPIFALLLNAVITKKKLKLREVSLLTMALSGVVFLNIHKGFSFSGNDLTGSVLMIISAIILAVTTLLFKDVLNDHTEGEVLYFQNAFGALIFIPIVILEIPSVALIPTFTGIFYGLSVGIIGFGCFFYALKRLTIFQYGAFGYIEVFFGVLFGIFLLGEDLSWNIIIGVILILVSSFLSRVSKKENID
ncbi:MAG: DMT family transporter [Spirochaetaceae bacterium]